MHQGCSALVIELASTRSPVSPLSCVDQVALSWTTIVVELCLEELRSLLVSRAVHASISRCLFPESWCVLRELIVELLVLVLADVCDRETLVDYGHRDVSALGYSTAIGSLDTYAARFCAFRLRCAGVKGSFSSDVALLRRL